MISCDVHKNKKSHPNCLPCFLGDKGVVEYLGLYNDKVLMAGMRSHHLGART